MFDNINWEKMINNVLSCIDEEWKYLIIKADASQTSYSVKFYYLKGNDEFVDLYNVIEHDKKNLINKEIMIELMKITKKFKYSNEKIFLTIKAENNGNVKVIYKDIKDGNRVPFDESQKHLQLNENDKIM